MSKKLRCLGLDPDVVGRLHRHHFMTCKDVLSRNHVDLMNLLNVSCQIVSDLIKKASQASAPTPVTALDLLKLRNRKENCAFLTTSLVLLDQVLRGGIPVSTITEIAGPSGCGKTQFCLMMTLNALMLDDCSGVIYIDTESAFNAHRLAEIAVARHPDIFTSHQALKQLMSRVFVYAERTISDLMKCLEQLEEIIITHKAKLVVVDSIASLVRKEFDVNLSKNMIERTKLLSKQAAILKYYAESYSVPVLVTNQVTTHFAFRGPNEDELPDASSISTAAEGGYVTVALGNTWSHCVNTRLIIQYVDRTRREILVAKSPVAPFVKFVYTIQERGFVIEEDGAFHYDGTDPGLQAIKTRSAVTSDVC